MTEPVNWRPSSGSIDAGEPSPTSRNDQALRMHNACGVLTVRAFNLETQPSPTAEAQFDDALRKLNATAIGASLLRDIDSYSVPPEKRPVCIFHELDPFDFSMPELENTRFSDAPTINFLVLPEAVANCPKRQAYRLMGLYAELLVTYAYHMGKKCPEPWAGFESYRMSAFREEINEPADPWHLDMESYVLEEHNGEDRSVVKDCVEAWMAARKPENELNLEGLNLVSCPPLRNLPGLTKLNLAENQLTAFPSSESLPDSVREINLAVNPIRTGAAHYGPNLQQVTLSPDDIALLKRELPATIQIVEWTARLMARQEFAYAFPYPDMISIPEMERRGFDDAKTAEMCDADMLEKSVEAWLDPIPVKHMIWRHVQETRPNESFVMNTMLKRLAEMPAAKNLGFRRWFADLLDKMQQPNATQFLSNCMTIASEGAESCNDRLLDTLNRLDIASQNADAEAGLYDQKFSELMIMGEQMFALHTMTQFITASMPKLKQRFAQRPDAVSNPDKVLDELEQYLMLWTRLAEKNPRLLPPMQFDMMFVVESILTDDDIKRAHSYITQAKETDLIPFLGAWAPFRSVIERTTPRLIERENWLREYIHNDRGLLYDWLNHLLNAQGNLFVSRSKSQTMLFRVKYRTFWTRFERLVHRDLVKFGAGRDDSDLVAQVASGVETRIQDLLHSDTVQQFMRTHKLYSGSWIKTPEKPPWFKKLLRYIA